MLKRFGRTVHRLNDQIAEILTAVVGSMWCAYAFVLLALSPLVFKGIEAQVQYVSSSFLQLVLLPVVMVGQAVASHATERRARRDHEMLTQQNTELKMIVAELRWNAREREHKDVPIAERPGEAP